MNGRGWKQAFDEIIFPYRHTGVTGGGVTTQSSHLFTNLRESAFGENSDSMKKGTVS